MKLLNDIYEAHRRYEHLVKELEKELSPYLENYLEGQIPCINIREDEGGGLYILGKNSISTLYLDKDHIEFIKKNKKLMETEVL